jgi:hypothetical protein
MKSERPSRAGAYFEAIKSLPNGANFLKGLVGAATPPDESEFLEFKGGHNILADPKNLKSLWAKNLGCFANTDGGLLIFGIEAPKGSAKSISLVQDLDRLKQLLKGWLPTITEPPVQRVEIEAYLDPPSSNTGFLVCLIPPSPWRPHQVRTDGQPDQFYVRAADNCIPCGVSTLRALFAPQYVARLVLHFRVETRVRNVQGWQDVILECVLENMGPATASELFVISERPRTVNGPMYDKRLWEDTASVKGNEAFVAKRSIHPQEKVRLCDFGLGNITKEGLKQIQADPVRLVLSFSARNQAATKYEIFLRANDVEDFHEFGEARLIET